MVRGLLCFPSLSSFNVRALIDSMLSVPEGKKQKKERDFKAFVSAGVAVHLVERSGDFIRWCRGEGSLIFTEGW